MQDDSTGQVVFQGANFKRTCLHLGDKDRARLEQIRHRLGLPSKALAVRLAIERLARHLDELPDSGN